MSFEVTGSPLQARQKPALYRFIMISLGVLFVIFMISLIAKKIYDWHKSEKYIEEHKKLPTTKKNVKVVAHKAGLSGEERKLLLDICRKYRPANIEYLIKDRNEFYGLFKMYYSGLKEDEAPEEYISTLFSTLFKIEKIYYDAQFISTTNSLKQGQEFIYKSIDGREWILTLDQNTPQSMSLSIPKALFTSEQKPELLTKFMMTLNAKGGISYTFLTRAIRYGEPKEGTYLLYVTSSNALKPVKRRRSKRLGISTPCTFQTVKPVAKNREEHTMYEKGESIYAGFIQDVSAEGCSISFGSSIKNGQYIQVKFEIEGKEVVATGLTISSSKTSSETHSILHIKFTDISIEAKNTIHAFIYNFSDEHAQDFDGKD